MALSSFEFSSGHEWLLEAMRALNYQINSHGVCVGLAFMAAQAVLTQQLSSFEGRMRLIRLIPPDQLSNAIALARLEQSQGTELASPLLEIPPFFDGIYLYQYHNQYAEFFPPDHIPKTQDEVTLVSAVVSSKELDQLGGMIDLGGFSSIYDETSLMELLNSLRLIVEEKPEVTQPIVLTLNSATHTNLITLDPVKDCWRLIITSDFVIEEIPRQAVALLARKIIDSFSFNTHAALSIGIIGTKKNEVPLKKIVTHWVNHPAWKRTHTISIEKAELQDSNEVSWLYIAAQFGRLHEVRRLLEVGADIDMTSHDGTSALYIASQQGHLDVVTLLLEAYADVNSTWTIDNTTPLFVAAQQGFVEVVEVLYKHGANLELANTENATPLFIAAQQGHLEVVKFLLQQNAKTNAICNGYYPLSIASEKNHAEIVKIIRMHQLIHYIDTSKHHVAETGFFKKENLMAAEALLRVISEDASSASLEIHKEALKELENKLKL